MPPPLKKKLTPADAAEDNPALARLLAERKDPQPDRTCPDFWTVLVFQSAEQCHEFWSKFPEIRAAFRGAYVDGVEFAGRIGVELTPCKFPPIDPDVDEAMRGMTLDTGLE